MTLIKRLFDLLIYSLLILSGTGKIEINGQDINYFQFVQPKETVSFSFSFVFLKNV